MGVPAHELGVDALRDGRQVARAALLEQQRQEVDLEEHVAELVEELGVVTPVGGVGQLVGLLDGVGDDRALVLLAVPRALAAQAAGQLVEAADGALEVAAAHRAAAALARWGRAPGWAWASRPRRCWWCPWSSPWGRSCSPR